MNKSETPYENSTYKFNENYAILYRGENKSIRMIIYNYMSTIKRYTWISNR